MVYTTGGVAKLCRVAPRTVMKWCDSGDLPHARLPSRPGTGGDRRITHEALVAFLKRYRMQDALRKLGDGARPLVVGPASLAERLRTLVPDLLHAADAFTAGLACATQYPPAAVLDLGDLGREATAAVIQSLRASVPEGRKPPTVVVIVPEDCDLDARARLVGIGASRVLVQPIDVAQVAAMLVGN
jgi:CheY-like chemotaxis protein